MNILLGIAAVLIPSLGFGAALSDLKPVAPTTECATLAQAELASIVGAPVKISEASVRDSYCKVRGVISPAITFEVRLPVKGWTQRFLQTGCGGLCGNLNIRVDRPASCAPAENHELVLASTDMGHQGMDTRWAAEDPQKKIDFAYRGVHLTTVAAKALIAKYYGQPPKFSYFTGCSDGGREALMEAQRYPADFDGIGAGAPALNFTVQNTFYHAWNAVSNTNAQGRAILTADKLPILHAAALRACDELDGLKDGLISDPFHCKFDPAAVVCKDGQNESTCLTKAQVETARKIYEGAHSSDGGKLVISGPLPGSELNWRGVYIPQSAGQPIFSEMIAMGTIRNIAYEKPLPETFAMKDFKFDRENFEQIKKIHPTYDATNPDLSAFAAHHGKLLLWHGLADPHISPLNTVAYYEAVEKTLGAARTKDVTRLFLFPGGDHCARGEGPFEFPLLQTLMEWTEGGVAPDKITATKPGRSRPAFPYPAMAVYSGKGSIDDAASFVPKAAPVPEAQFEWMGSAFFKER